jgi:hypothetical protein
MIVCRLPLGLPQVAHRVSADEPDGDEEDGEHCEQDQGKRAAVGPVEGDAELGLDLVAVEQLPGAADEVRSDELTGHRHEHEDDAGDDAGRSERKHDLPEDPDALRAERGGRPQEVGIQAFEGHIERDDHERQVEVDFGDQDPEPTELEYLKRIVRDSGPGEELVDDALLSEAHLPGEDSHDVRGPPRNDDQNQDEVSSCRRLAGENPSRGKSNRECDHRDAQCEQEAPLEQLSDERVVKELAIGRERPGVLEVKVVDDREADSRHPDERDQEEQQIPDARRGKRDCP